MIHLKKISFNTFPVAFHQHSVFSRTITTINSASHRKRMEIKQQRGIKMKKKIADKKKMHTIPQSNNNTTNNTTKAKEITNTSHTIQNNLNDANNESQTQTTQKKTKEKNHMIITPIKLEASLVGELGFREERWTSAKEIASAAVIAYNNFDNEVEEPLAFCKQIMPNKHKLEEETRSLEKITTEIGRYVIKSYKEEKERNPDNKTKSEKMSWRLHLFTPSSPIHPFTQGRGSLFKEVTKFIAKNKPSIPRMREIPQITTMENFFEIAKNNKKDLFEFEPNEGLMQVYFLQQNKIYLSFCPPDLRKKLRSLISPFPAGILHIPHLPIQENSSDESCSLPPSSAYAKLAEVQVRMGRYIQAGDVCVDFGACPGGWSWLALKQGAKVVAVDWTPLAANLMKHPSLKFHHGDAMEFSTEKLSTLIDSPTKGDFVVDWILSDIAALPNKALLLIEKWVKTRKCKNFCFTLKFVGSESYGILGMVKDAMISVPCQYYLHQLNANGNELTIYGYWE
eukprot:TRINITY_DN2848_c0_g2_i2.p1 TRINITY_DN2848_c0_g2~~TRINITY_DN2848_c0_g2_i2.p1  ORF type:complete len:510 (-),score=113.97 TRINITY_DN2848_c0_g2_i2:269-1798(-)